MCKLMFKHKTGEEEIRAQGRVPSMQVHGRGVPESLQRAQEACVESPETKEIGSGCISHSGLRVDREVQATETTVSRLDFSILLLH